jgi:hypothetical protein
MGDFHVWMASGREGKINILVILNVEVIEENDLEGEGATRKELQSFA